MSSGESIALLPLAQAICRRYRIEFPDERDRYGQAGEAWCVHDSLYLLSWAVDDADGSLVMETEVAWLARVLEARAFPWLGWPEVWISPPRSSATFRRQPQRQGSPGQSHGRGPL